MAGGLTHRRTRMIRYHPGYYGKRGLKRFNHSSGFDYSNPINIEKIAEFVPKEMRNEANHEGHIPKINLTELVIF